MVKSIDLTGQQFGCLTVLKDSGERKWGQKMWLCPCECGKQTIIGRFKNKQEAIIARLKAKKKYYGENASQRHLFKEYGIE